MSKIICDVCGTSYPETTKQCPICGAVAPGDVQRVNNDVDSDGKVSTGYTYVRGGRFSKNNVKRRSQPEKKAKETEPVKNTEEKSNRGLVITAIVLLLAIIGVVIYIALRFFYPISNPDGNNTTGNTLSTKTDLSCTGITLDTDTILFEQIGEARLLQVTIEPQNTTDATVMTSADESVATVNAVGKITAVGEGTTKITITCGDFTKECTVTVQLPQESTGYTDPTVETTTPDATTSTDATTAPESELRLNRNDLTFSSEGEAWVLYNGEIAKNLITWTSDDESVATFVDGKAVAVGGGMTEVHAEYNGQKATCIIRCSFKASTGVGGSGGGVSEDGGDVVQPDNGGSAQPDGGTSTQTVTGTVNVNEYLNVRQEPSTAAALVTQLLPNQKVTITEQKTVDGMTWGKIAEGWIAMQYVIVDAG